ncbi:hypothetical protein IW261DRAFT_1423170 [Armillaria novae-zelandiae]|uniref:Uncharacterized protein n=1 Tax=Armillaria novae-zelandiae TaxID=153914 RepID=A0AA39NYU3_9AGAR|nr:hypothetical protein IW261DRAFT_1423170 [Armillaria novae-zelandiae]
MSTTLWACKATYNFCMGSPERDQHDIIILGEALLCKSRSNDEKVVIVWNMYIKAIKMGKGANVGKGSLGGNRFFWVEIIGGLGCINLDDKEWNNSSPIDSSKESTRDRRYGTDHYTLSKFRQLFFHTLMHYRYLPAPHGSRCAVSHANLRHYEGTICKGHRMSLGHTTLYSKNKYVQILGIDITGADPEVISIPRVLAFYSPGNLDSYAHSPPLPAVLLGVRLGVAICGLVSMSSSLSGHAASSPSSSFNHSSRSNSYWQWFLDSVTTAKALIIQWLAHRIIVLSYLSRGFWTGLLRVYELSVKLACQVQAVTKSQFGHNNVMEKAGVVELLLDGFQLGSKTQGKTVMDKFQIMESVVEYSYTGYAFTLPHSGKTIVIYPFIFVLSADYEEHCMMTLIRGVRSACPCPVCLVPDKNLMDITEVYPLRTTENMQKCYHQAQEVEDDILKSSGLRNMKNVFWSMDRSDPYRTVSWDRLHAYHLGLFKHLLLCLLEHVERIHRPDKCKAKVIIDEFITNFPRWQNLIHFTNQILFAAHSVLTKAKNPNAYLLLKVIQSYIELDMYTSMDVHMEKSIDEGRQLLGVFEANLKAYSQATDHMVWKNVTSWSLPKVHMQQHLFDDIIAKGATKNYNTKVNECMHGPLKEAYQTQTNFKNVADQILMTDHKYGIAMKL